LTGNPESIVPPASPVITAVSASTPCNGASAALTATKGSYTTSAMTYTWTIGETSNTNYEHTFTTGNLTENTTYTVTATNAAGCASTATGGTITVYDEFSPGSITTASGKAVDKCCITVANDTEAAGGDESITYQWRLTGSNGVTPATLTGSAAAYNTGADTGYEDASSTYYINRYAKDVTCETEWVASAGTYTIVTPPDGGTFQAFNPSTATVDYMTLTDERDEKKYAVTKIGDFWIMAQNLNYQTAMTYYAQSAQPTTTSGQDSKLIGAFWCTATHGATTSSIARCNIWGALYTWDTAMSPDGIGTATITGTTNCSGLNNTDPCKQNWGRSSSGATSGGHGICPAGWHVPTNYEWALILDQLETSTTPCHTSASSTNGNCTDAGKHAKSKCEVTNTCSSAYTTSNADSRHWLYNASALGDDTNGLNVIPAGRRSSDGGATPYTNYLAYMMSSSVDGSNQPIVAFDYNNNYARFQKYARAVGTSVRCTKQ
jgi:uncharacterized protein (TIGR02145 family)